MALVFDFLHLVAATLLAVIGFGYEREEECNPVHFQPAAHAIEANRQNQHPVFVTNGTMVIEVSECDSEVAVISYPVL